MRLLTRRIVLPSRVLKSDVRNANPLIVPRTRSRRRFGHTFAGSNGTVITVHCSPVPSGRSVPSNFCLAPTAPA
jgi:hypothetical protein